MDLDRFVAMEVKMSPDGMEHNPLQALHDCGQSVWLDFIRRDMLASGELKQLIEADGVRGVTSNPSIFEKAIGSSDDYDDTIRTLVQEGKRTHEIYEAVVVEDIRRAADLFRPLYDREDGRDGYVSLEVSPHLAHDTRATLEEGRRLWAAVDRPNVFIKVPATAAGIPAIQQLIDEGINVNVTLLFGLSRYREVVAAYIAGLEARAKRGEPLVHVASVASFFLSRIDVLVDPMLAERGSAGDAGAGLASALQGKVAIASAKAAYEIYTQVFRGEQFGALAARGAHAQRLLWASTSTKNPAYSDVKYVEDLIGPQTVNTMPMETLVAYRDHGRPAARLEDDMASAREVLQRLPDLGIDLGQITWQLEAEGIQKFIDAYDRLMEILGQKQSATTRPAPGGRKLPRR